MEKFSEIQSIWNQQQPAMPQTSSEAIATKSLQKIKEQRAKHYWTIGLLTALMIVLIYFYNFIYVDVLAYKIKGLALMILVMAARCLLEIVCIVKFRRIDFSTSLKSYSHQLIIYYKLRKAVHFFFTPVVYLLYVIGFISLLPLFKENLSKGFYIYVLVSGFGFLTFFSFLLFRIMKKDLADLRFLQTSGS